MADNTTPSRAANMEKAEGDRDNAGGISNRTLDEEAGRQQAVPERGRGRADERNHSDERSPGSERGPDMEKRSRDRSAESGWPSPRSDR